MPDISEQSPEETVARLDAAARRVETPCGNGTMVWRVWGAGAPLILLHGNFGSWLHWARNIGALAGHYRVIAPDAPGQGESAMPPVPDTVRDIAAVLVDGLDAVLEPGERARLVGFSFGSRLACQIAAQAPARVASLLLIAPAGLGAGDSPPPGLHRQRRDMTADERADAHRHNLGIAMIADPARVDDLAIHIQNLNSRAARFRMTVWTEDEQLNSLLHVLPEIHAPISAIWSDNDAFARNTMQQRIDALRALQPGVDIRMLEGPGHWSQYEAPERFNALLLEMLAGDGPCPSTSSG